MSSVVPSSWLRLDLGDVIDYGTTQKIEPQEISPETWVLELEDVEKESSRVLQRLNYAERNSKSAKNKFEAGDVLYGKLRPYLNKVIYADSSGVCTTEIIPLKANFAVNAKYLFHWLKHPEFLNYVTEVSHGVNMPRLGTEAGRKAPFILAPCNEQRRIADKLDTVLTRVDALNDRLARITPLLKRFRQSVLAAGTSGRLTEDWRGGGAHSWCECPLAQIVEEALTGLVRSSASQIAAPFVASSVHPYLKMGNIGEFWGHGITDLVGVNCSDEEFARFELRAGDWIFNTRNSVELVGKSCVWRGRSGVVFNNNLLRLRFKTNVKPDWVEIFFRSPTGKSLLGSVTSATTSVAAIYQRSLFGLNVSLPSIEEQTEIVRRVEILFAYADRLEARLQSARTAADRLTPALLAKAFRGELVPQDPNDEPAIELLRRLREARAAAAPAKKARGRRAPAA